MNVIEIFYTILKHSPGQFSGSELASKIRVNLWLLSPTIYCYGRIVKLKNMWYIGRRHSINFRNDQVAASLIAFTWYSRKILITDKYTPLKKTIQSSDIFFMFLSHYLGFMPAFFRIQYHCKWVCDFNCSTITWTSRFVVNSIESTESYIIRTSYNTFHAQNHQRVQYGVVWWKNEWNKH